MTALTHAAALSGYPAPGRRRYHDGSNPSHRAQRLHRARAPARMERRRRQTIFNTNYIPQKN